MTREKWSAVDRYFNGLLTPSDAVLDAALAASEKAEPTYAVAPNQGKFLSILVKSHKASKVLEIGTLCGYSTIWMARALPDGGRIVTLEAEPSYAEIARANLESAGLADRVEIHVGEALHTLPQLTGPFDLVFIDADKDNIPDYFTWAMKLCRPGSLIIVDNVARDGEIADENTADPWVQPVRRLAEMLSAEPRVDATAMQTVGSKGHDGFLMAVYSG
jgi:predicted O-methyltransferase YrrM